MMDLEEALKKDVIREMEPDEEIVEKEMREAERDIDKARENLEKTDYKWSIIASYYSMFHMVKAVMFSEGYMERGHLAILVFLDYLIKQGKIQRKYKNYFSAAKEAREDADYRYTYSSDRANEIINYVEEFNSKLRELL